MKPFAFLLSFVVLILSIAPCCALSDHLKQTEKQIVMQKNTPQAEDCCQDCSPFYTCGTCGGFMVTPLVAVNTPTPILLPTSFNHLYLQSFADGINQNIWQPPKIS